MGGGSTTGRAVVQSAGRGFQLPSRVLMQEFNRGSPVMHLLLRYTQALLTQMSQTAGVQSASCPGPTTVSLAGAASSGHLISTDLQWRRPASATPP